MKKRRIICVLIAIFLMSSLIGCGAGKDGNTGKDGKKVTLRVATWREFDKEYYEEIKRRFEEKYDYIDVQLEFNADENSYNANIQTDITTGVVADVFDIHHNGTMQMYGQYGFILDQSDMEYMNNYDENAKAINSWDGKNYAYMFDYNYFGCLYNMDVFDELGLEIPTTPEELVQIVARLKEAGYGGIAYPGSRWGTTFAKGCIISSLGTEAYDKLMLGMDQGTVTDITTVDGLKDALATVQLYADNDIFYTASQSVDYEPALSLFATKKAAILWGGTYFFGEKDIYFPDVNAGFFPTPTYAGNGVCYAEPGQCTCIYANGDHIAEAKLWVNFVAQSEISEYYCTNAKMFSAIRGVEPQFEEAKMIRSSSSNYALIKSNYYENAEWWSAEWEDMLEGIFWNKDSYQSHIDIVNAQLKSADIANKKK